MKQITRAKNYFCFITQRKMKKYIVALFLSVGVFSASFAQSSAVANNTLRVTTDQYFSSVEGMIELGKKYLGVRYTYGGTSPSGFDCSGFVSFLFNSYGFKISKASRDLAHFGTKVDGDCLQPGDLAFFKGRSSKSTDVGHVALVIQAIDGRWDIIHATVHKGIWIDKDVMNIDYYKQRFLMFRRPFELI